MAKEIERKYLVAGNSYEEMATSSVRMAQGYLSRRKEATVRVRLSDGNAFLTVKGENCGAVRDEWEYAIPAEDARQMLACCDGGVIEKTRYRVPFEGHVWEVDCFHGHLDGLVVAEIELPDADCRYAVPPFVCREVTGDPRYYNSSLAVAVNPPEPSRAE